MKILKKGKVVPFACGSCDCKFVAGIHAARTPDHGENYYADCPMCGAECHADVVDIQKNEEKRNT